LARERAWGASVFVISPSRNKPLGRVRFELQADLGLQRIRRRDFRLKRPNRRTKRRMLHIIALTE
jgi:hypothetical protein